MFQPGGISSTKNLLENQIRTADGQTRDETLRDPTTSDAPASCHFGSILVKALVVVYPEMTGENGIDGRGHRARNYLASSRTSIECELS